MMLILTNIDPSNRIVNPNNATYKNVTLFKKMSPLFQENVTPLQENVTLLQ